MEKIWKENSERRNLWGDGEREFEELGWFGLAEDVGELMERLVLGGRTVFKEWILNIINYMESEINTDKYSRQIGAFGLKTMGKLMKMKVLIVGLRGLGAETAKNLILAGPQRVDVYDRELVAVRDLGANWFIGLEHVGKVSRAEAWLSGLKELNDDVTVEIVEKEITEELWKLYSLVIVTELFWSSEQLFRINEAWRENGTGFILAQTLGLYGYTFVDFGDNFVIQDLDGEDLKSFIITNITNDKQAEVCLHSSARHSFHDKSMVQISEVQGMTEINDSDPISITVINGYKIKLDWDTTNFSAYKKEGKVTEVKPPKNQKFNSLRDTLSRPLETSFDGCFITSDFSKIDRPGILHIAFQSVLNFYNKFGRLPSNEDVETWNKLCKSINQELKCQEGCWALDTIDDEVIDNVSRFSNCSISPMASFFGGIVAQEAVKFTGKYTPIIQWLHIDFFNALPKDKYITREHMNWQYDDQIAIFGREVQEKILKQNVFLVGAGALGWEFIKMFALTGVGCSSDGLVSWTDNDNIEISNLNRQFLFRKREMLDLQKQKLLVKKRSKWTQILMFDAIRLWSVVRPKKFLMNHFGRILILL